MPKTGYQPWTEEELAQLDLLYQQAVPVSVIAMRLQRPIGSVENKITRSRTRYPQRTEAQLRSIYGWPDHSQEERFFDEPKLQAERQRVADLFVGTEVRALVLSDLHGLFRHHAVLEAAQRAIKDQALNTLIIPGDLLDQHCASRFIKYKHVELQDEIVEMSNLLARFAKQVRRVVITQGNHDLRAVRLIAEKVPQLSVPLKGALNFLERCAEGLTNVIPMDSWWVRIGNVVFCHREKYTKQERTSGESNLRYFENRGLKDIGLIVQGHVHRACYFPLKRGTFYLENPMSAYRAEYTYESRSLDAILVAGYSIVHINRDGHFDPNKTGFRFVAWE